MEDERRAVLVHVWGRVQGVGYRAWTQSEAETLGLKGWVANESDGSVSATLIGTEAGVTQMIEHMWKGPATAAVSNVAVEATPIDHLEEPEGFILIETI
jgi:acylphosphatase